MNEYASDGYGRGFEVTLTEPSEPCPTVQSEDRGVDDWQTVMAYAIQIARAQEGASGRETVDSHGNYRCGSRGEGNGPMGH